jgi:alkanesulfonate monooxygenase SsuD/methylene tetrahydromethanopterin reductase-like flavin-dependent oxidoreductase (luciferase family)
VDFSGNYYTARAKFPGAPKTPIYMSALRENAFEMAGELSDGGISWITPAEYLSSVSKGAITRGAERAGRPAPPIIAHTFVSARQDREQVRNAVKANLKYYVEAPFYQRMFAAAGFPIGADLAVPDALVDALTVSGSPGEIAAGLRARLESGLDELLIDVVPGDDQTAEEDAVFKVIQSM